MSAKPGRCFSASTGRRPRTPGRRGAPLPFVLVNMAMTADGKIATAKSAASGPGRVISSFGSPRDHEHLLELRASVDAVMAGARTVDMNPVNLGPGPARFRRVRLKRGLAEFNLRVIVSGSGTVNPGAEIFRRRFSPIVVLTTLRASLASRRQLRALADEIMAFGRSSIDFRTALQWLRARWRVKRLLCEGGGELNQVLFRAGLVDELHLTICPKVFGGRSAPTIADGFEKPTLAAATPFKLKSARRVGDEMFLLLVRAGGRKV